jgi:endoglucanase
MNHYAPIILLFIIITGTSSQFLSQDGILKRNGDRFYLNGINWYGFEVDSINCIEGLDKISIEQGITFLKENGFNALRIPFMPATIDNDTMPSYTIDFNKNPSLKNKKSIEILDILIMEAERQGMFVVLDLHKLNGEINVNQKLPTDSKTSLDDVIQVWKTIINRYIKNPTVFGADLFNEPHPITWAEWVPIAKTIAEGILSINPEILIFINGADNYNGDYGFWGGVFGGLQENPLILTIPDRVVYSSHQYGSSVFDQPYFNAANFPKNMPDIWDKYFGFVKREKLGTMTMGEWGGTLNNDKEIVWQNSFADYLISTGITDGFYWSYNPLSGGTGGIVDLDWVTPITDKLDIIKRIQDSSGGSVTFAINNNSTTEINTPSIIDSPEISPASNSPMVSSPTVNIQASPLSPSLPSMNGSDNVRTCQCKCNDGTICYGSVAFKVKLYGQCGNNQGQYAECNNSICKKINDWWMQCL